MPHVVMDETNSYQLVLAMPVTIAVPKGDNRHLDELEPEALAATLQGMVQQHFAHITEYHAAHHKELWADLKNHEPIHPKIVFGGHGVFEIDYDEEV